jgi:hypothetical protein
MVLTGSDQVAVGKQNSLGVAGRSGGVHDAAVVLGGGGSGLDGVVDTELLQFLEGDELEVGVSLLKGDDVGGLGLAIVDDLLQGGALAGDVLDGVEQVSIGVGGGDLGLVHRVQKTILAQGVVGGDDGDGLGESTVGNQEPVSTIGGESGIDSPEKKNTRFSLVGCQGDGEPRQQQSRASLIDERLTLLSSDHS